MKKQLGYIIIIVSAILIITFSLHVVKHKKFDRDIQFDTLEDRMRALNYYAQKAQENTGEDKEKYWIQYFQAFPRDFRTFFKLHHRIYNDTMYLDKTPYSYVFSTNPWGDFHPIEKVVPTREDIPKEPIAKLNFPDFKEWSYGSYSEILGEVQKYIPSEKYYKKMISVGMGGFWDADDVTELLMHIMGLVFQNIPLTIKILEEKTDDQIASFWFFLYDGPHPTHPDKKKWREELRTRIGVLSPRVVSQMDRAYEAVLACFSHEERSHEGRY